ncbi:hypothetical protein RHGRI_029097 [Rhododendron griersonianum]|uniref:Uncharacterized protein n=1 Tax=Rhododendron griersonianum TaxID=479676 RepID=A0AAV6IIB0_9ERIC|nr:hypothetical protein RHGRI_029097 [Rhododendron griersonianum]
MSSDGILEDNVEAEADEEQEIFEDDMDYDMAEPDDDYSLPGNEDVSDYDSDDSFEQELAPTRNQHDMCRITERETRSTSQPPRPLDAEQEIEAVPFVAPVDQVRTNLEDLTIRRWKAAEESVKAPMLQRIKDRFNLERDPIYVDKAVARQFGHRLSDYSHTLYRKYKKLKTTKGVEYARSHPPSGVSQE